MRFEKPHSLSYQLWTSTRSPPTTWVWAASTIDECELPMKSVDTSGVSSNSEKSWPYVKGTRLDFVRQGLNAGFSFNNPNAMSMCGCGESFSVDVD